MSSAGRRYRCCAPAARRESSRKASACRSRRLRNWRRQDQIDRHERDDGLASDEQDELRRLRRENARLRQERDLLTRAAAFFASVPE
jgi:transposase-like protein